MSSNQTVLVQVTGKDRPGITAGIMALLADSEALVQDIEQVVIRGRLSLGLVVEVPQGRDLLKELLLFGWEQHVDIEFEIVESQPTSRVPGQVITVLAVELLPVQIGAVTAAIAATGTNIDRIVRLSRYPVMSYEFAVSGGHPETLRAELVTVAEEHDLDIAVQDDGIRRRAKRLVVLDMDSTLIQDEAVDLLAESMGCLDEVQAITAQAMAGEVDFEQSLRSRVGLLRGLAKSEVMRAAKAMRLTPGARTFVRTLHRLGYRVAVVSGGFTQFTSLLAKELELDHHFANELEIIDGTLTGKVLGTVVDRAAKAELLRNVAALEGIPVFQTVAVGDGANDIDMLAAAGLGIAFNAKQPVQDIADTTISVPYLDAILYLLGVTREEIEAEDAADGVETRRPTTSIP
ncbi:MAG: phosphoserine phosphatase SerB, partial [Acidimicrobiales bacterium]